MAPFVALNTRGHGNARVCCSIIGMLHGIPRQGTLHDLPEDQSLPRGDVFNLKRDSVEDVWNSDFMRDLRMKMIRGEYVPNCSHCHSLEDKGLSSKRLSKNKTHAERRAALVAEAEANEGRLETRPSWWEVRLSTKCNLACRMCSPYLSSRIHAEYKAHFGEIDERKKRAVRNVDLELQDGYLGDSEFFLRQMEQNVQHIRHLEMRGGEVLVDEKAMDFLCRLTARTEVARQIHFDISTNLTLFTADTARLFNRFSGGHLRCSIDAFGSENDYIRHPAVWSKLERNLDLTRQLHKGWVRIVACTLQAYQVCTIDRLLRYFDDFNRSQAAEFFFGFTTIREVPFLALEVVPLAMREQAAKKVREFQGTSYMCNESPAKGIHSMIIENLIKALVNPSPVEPRRYAEFRAHTRLLDRLRGQDVLKVFPHLAPLMLEAPVASATPPQEAAP